MSEQFTTTDVPRPFEGAADLPVSIVSGRFLMVMTGETYETRVVRGADLVAALAGALFSNADDMPPDDVAAWTKILSDVDRWHCQHGVPLSYCTEFEDGSISFYRLTGSDGIDLMAAERSRQEFVEGFGAKRDDSYVFGELAAAGSAYAEYGAYQSQYASVPDCFCPTTWPWTKDWWKVSTDPVPNLVKAGALIAAEIDRLLRRRRKTP